MADLRSLMEIAPTTGGFFTGQQIASDAASSRLKDLETQADIAAKNQTFGFNEQNNPLKLQHAGLQNQGLQEGLAGITADSTRKGVEARVAQGTEASTIAEANSKSRFDVMKRRMDEGKMYTDFFGSTAQEIQQVPPMQRAAYLRQKAAQHGINPDDPEVQSLFQQASQNPQVLFNAFQKSRQTLAQLTPEFIREQMKEQEATKRNAATNASHEKISKTSAEARVAAVKAKLDGSGDDLFKRYKEGRVSPANAAGMFQLHAELEDDPDKKALYLKMARLADEQALRLKREGAAGRPDAAAMGIETVPPQKPVMGQGDGPPPGSAQNPIKLD